MGWGEASGDTFETWDSGVQSTGSFVYSFDVDIPPPPVFLLRFAFLRAGDVMWTCTGSPGCGNPEVKFL